MTARPSPSAAGSRMVELDREESLGLLAGVSMGRVGFTHQALPVIRPVNHLVSNGGDIVIRTHAGAALLASAWASEVVVYEADEIDAATRTGWSVMVTGTASRVTEPQELSRFNAELSPWINTEMEHVVRIRAELVTGYRLLR
ncbi:pyridoxamine 5'-phosphate oxidase family protein [Streptomyces ferrugineus]|uniref:Pyridoxamine 5'-phosphate oxidase family protein n=1 Tax=Streptomyces ferrugineus TaxID=1413221 RepID=A0A7M2SCI3_9ACTN|nr:pyridoxamine 5'-phosphate oxidase family protein [Streptomyces ferrugineus]QOV34034.1 pyridoxamine 5'-phosphate oxidase family protein [Streptomyces ferrugineus]